MVLYPTLRDLLGNPLKRCFGVRKGCFDVIKIKARLENCNLDPI